MTKRLASDKCQAIIAISQFARRLFLHMHEGSAYVDHLRAKLHVRFPNLVEMHHAALPSRLGQMLRGALRQAAAGIGNDQLHPLEAAIDQVSQKRRPARFVLLGALADAENLPKALRIDGAGHQQRDIAHFASPTALHYDAVEIEIRMLAFDAPVPPSLDLGVNLLVEVRHRARAHPRAPEGLRNVLHSPH
jgi:hypothetical protein